MGRDAIEPCRSPAGTSELPPLTMGDLSIAADELLRGLGGAGVMTEAEGDFEALMRMGVTFARKKSEHYEFGTAIMLTRYSSNDINTARGSHKLSMVSSD